MQEDCHYTLYYYEINEHLWFGMFLFTIWLGRKKCFDEEKENRIKGILFGCIICQYTISFNP